VMNDHVSTTERSNGLVTVHEDVRIEAASPIRAASVRFTSRRPLRSSRTWSFITWMIFGPRCPARRFALTMILVGCKLSCMKRSYPFFLYHWRVRRHMRCLVSSFVSDGFGLSDVSGWYPPLWVFRWSSGAGGFLYRTIFQVTALMFDLTVAFVLGVSGLVVCTRKPNIIR